MTCFDPNLTTKKRIAVRIAPDGECNDFAVQDQVCDFLSRMTQLVPFRRMRKKLLRAAKKANTVLLDTDGQPAALADLADEDYYKFDYWLRDHLKSRPMGLARRNRDESLERRRYIITLARLAFPRELAALAKSPEELGLETTEHDPFFDQIVASNE